MRLAPPPPDIRLPDRHAHEPLLRALAMAQSAVARHERTLALALEELGDIDLPSGAPNVHDRVRLQAAAPLYFASELERAGVLPTAELVAGLFASGAITQPLGPTVQLLHTFWRERRERLDADERAAIFARVIESPYFDRLMQALCEAIVAQADGSDIREQVGVATSAQTMAEFLAQRTDAMASLAARDIIDTLNKALVFLRDRMLQAAFGVHSLWALVALTASQQPRSVVVSSPQIHAERGRAGQIVLLWLADHFTETALRLDPQQAQDVEIIVAAQRWLAAQPILPPAPASVAPALPAGA